MSVGNEINEGPRGSGIGIPLHIGGKTPSSGDARYLRVIVIAVQKWGKAQLSRFLVTRSIYRHSKSSVLLEQGSLNMICLMLFARH
ncbi:hypothetical protein [Candidatus Ichthyocystis sparus]|uniref:hypothetical protein n=1 Tax=Candidatus Ichthyocystis sparus TaxID=1561004 RepID=UPI000B88E047|nr:hypothetical protein [Candidatus Ichthyocystis sparus]